MSDEKQKLEPALQNLHNGTPIASLFNKAAERFEQIRESLQNQAIHGNIRQLMLRICNFKETVWEETSNSLKFNAKLSRNKHKKLQKKFDVVGGVLNICEFYCTNFRNNSFHA